MSITLEQIAFYYIFTFLTSSIISGNNNNSIINILLVLLVSGLWLYICETYCKKCYVEKKKKKRYNV